MRYETKTFSHLRDIPGFDDALLDMHLTLYAGYVSAVNTLIEQLRNARHGTPEYAEMKRRLGWEFGGMRLHELYFENMTADTTTGEQDAPNVVELITESYGSMENWEKDFRATGTIRGIGWVVLAYDPMANTVYNTWINEHDLGHLSQCTPLLVMDVFEHAYITAYGLDRAAYIERFMAAIDWRVVAARHAGGTH